MILYYFVAVVIGLCLGQVTNHLIRRLPAIIEDDKAFKKLFPTLEQNFKLDIKYSGILILLNILVTYFLGVNYISYVYMFLFSMLIVALVIDFKMQLIPDTVQAGVLLLATLVTIVDYKNFLCHIIRDGIFFRNIRAYCSLF